MPLRKCASCGDSLPAGATARAKFCSPTCRKRASRAKGETPTLTLVLPAAQIEGSPTANTSRLAALEAAAVRLDRLLDEADPRSASALNKEYRETLRELETLRGAETPKGEHDRTDRSRRPFDASAI